MDGQEVPIYQVDYLLQGVLLEAGGHQVELAYHLSWVPAIISLALLLGCIAALILGQRGRPLVVQPRGDGSPGQQAAISRADH